MSKKRTTIIDVAKAVGMNYSTVSLALRGDTRIRVDTRNRIQLAAAQLGYMPNHLAKSLSGGATRVIGVMLTDMNSFFAPSLEEFQSVGELAGYTVTVHFCSWDPARELRDLQRFCENCVEGVIWAPSRWNATYLTQTAACLDRSRIPVVLMGRAVDSEPVTYHQVGVQVEESVELGLQYLMAKGHRRIGLATASGMPGVRGEMHRRRLPWFRQAYNRMHLPLTVEDIFETDDNDHGGMEIAMKLLQRPKSSWPSAIFAADDMLARGLYKGLTLMNVQVPDNIGILGFDVPDESVTLPMPITTVSLETRNAARMIMDVLLKVIDGQLPQKPARVLSVEPKIIERTSC